MKKNNLHIIRSLFLVFVLTTITLALNAQDKIVIDKAEAENWFVRNWYWVAGAVLLLLIIGLGSSSSVLL